MRRPERAARVGEHFLAERPGHRGNRDYLQRLGLAQWRQYACKPPCQHGLPRSRRAEEKDVVPTGGGDLQRSLRPGLPRDVGPVEIIARGARHRFRARRVRESVATQPAHKLTEICRGGELHAAHARSLSDIGARQDECLDLTAVRDVLRERQRAPYCSQRAVESKLSDEKAPDDGLGWDLTGGGKNAECNRKVERRPVLPDVSGREIDSQSPWRQCEAAVHQRGTYPVATFLHRTSRKSDDGPLGQPLRGVNLDCDGVGVYPDDGGRRNRCKHALSIASPNAGATPGARDRNRFMAQSAHERTSCP